jgi:hypothetical protein
MDKLRQEMVDLAHDRGDGHGKKEIEVAVTMQVRPDRAKFRNLGKYCPELIYVCK